MVGGGWWCALSFSLSLSLCIILCELTNGAEEGFANAKLRKEGRYATLMANSNDDMTNPWTALLFTIEVGARGFVGYSQ